MRLDQWLWAVRIFKSRTLASDAIKAARVRVNGVLSKPAHEVRREELVTVSFWEKERTWRVLDAPQSRVGAKLAPGFAEEIQKAADA